MKAHLSKCIISIHTNFINITLLNNTVVTTNQIPSLNEYISTNTEALLSLLTLTSEVLFSLGADSKDNLLAKTALQVSSYFSYLGFLCSVISDIHTPLNNCITSIPTKISTLTLNNVRALTASQLSSKTCVLRQATTLTLVWSSNIKCITLDMSGAYIATLDFHINDGGTSPAMYDTRLIFHSSSVYYIQCQQGIILF